MFKVLDGCKSPERATKYSAAIDLFAAEDKVIKAGETAKVRLGVCIKWQDIMNIVANESNLAETDVENYNIFMQSHYLQLEPRSSLRAKGLIAGTGIIDKDSND